MSEETQNDPPKKTLSLSGKTLSVGGGVLTAKPPRTPVAQSRGRGSAAVTNTVAVEIRRRRAPKGGQEDKASSTDHLNAEERETRQRALDKELENTKPLGSSLPPRQMPAPRSHILSSDRTDGIVTALSLPSTDETEGEIFPSVHDNALKSGFSIPRTATEVEKDRKKPADPTPPRRGMGEKRRDGRITVTQAVNKDYDKDRGQSLAAQRRTREKARLAAKLREAPKKILREVILPETITVQELAGRMAEPVSIVIKALMKMGVMATINQTIDADTAELVALDFGHKIRRVADSDIEIGLGGFEDTMETLVQRPPVVTIMGHVDHGKTSLLDALRSTNVVGGEAGGITQHIGAYQIVLPTGEKITFLDTPGHEAFTAMRARGAMVTDIVVIVIAANDSIMPQTIEAINHARAAEVPLIIAINKIDLPGANPDKIRQDLLQYNVQVESMGGSTLCVEISAKKRINLEGLEGAILLQAEMLELSANPNRPADAVVVEAKQEKGRGSVATVLVRRGTLRVGDVFIAGAQTGKVRALLDDKGRAVEEAFPGQPVEVLGLNATPFAGDSLVVVVDEARAREVASYRQHKRREIEAAIALKRRTTLDQLLAQKAAGQKTTLPILIKADVHGSIEALVGSLQKVVEDNVGQGIDIRILHTGVGGITESDVTLARASGGLIIGFNVRAGAMARQMAQRDGVEIKYYSVIYTVVDEIKAILSGMLSPSRREVVLGNAHIREIFHITKVGNVAGCMVTEGIMRRGAHVRLLRDDVVVHEGVLKTVRRFKEDVKEVREGMECGLALERYENIEVGDSIECYDVVEEARTVE